MITRGPVSHSYDPTPTGRENGNEGVVRMETIKGIPQTWAIARPTGGYPSGGAPHYLAGQDRPNGRIIRGGVMALTPGKPNVEMDPSNPQTWQRQYLFS